MKKNAVLLVFGMALFAAVHLISAADTGVAQTETNNESSAHKSKNIDKIDDIGAVIYAWANAWKSKDFNRYMSFYSKAFQSKDLNYAGWMNKKSKLFQKPGTISLEVFYLGIFIKNNNAYVSFIQKYKDAYHSDVGEKKLILIHSDGTWKIVSEEWTPLASEGF